MSANSSRRSYDVTGPSGPTARSRLQVSAPDPTPASTTCAPGKMSAIVTIWAASFGIDDGGAAWHRHHEVGQQRPQHEVLDAALTT